MATLIAVETEGQVRSVCDAKCYNAMGADCVCPCQGSNHGMGREIAVQNTRELAAAQAARDAQPDPGPGAEPDRLVYFLPAPEPETEPEAEAG